MAELREGKLADSDGKMTEDFYVLFNSISVISGQIVGGL